MKKLLIVVFFLISNAGFLSAQDVIDTWNQSMELYQAGNYSQAAQLVERIKHQFEDNPWDYTDVLFFLGSLYRDMGNYTQAEKYYLEAKTLVENVFGKDDSMYASTLNNLGSLYRAMGNHFEAEQYLLEAKKIREDDFDNEGASYASTLNNLGGLYRDMGNYVQAEKYYLEAKTIYENVLGKEHPNYAISINNLGVLYRTMGIYSEAEKYLLEAKAMDELILGKDHPSYATTLNNLGALYSLMNHYSQAEKYFLEAKTIRERLLGKNHPDYSMTLNNLGNLYRLMGNYSQAEKYLLESTTIDELLLGEDHPDFAISLNNLGILYLAAKNFPAAQAMKIKADQIMTAQVEKTFSFLSERQRSLFWDKNKHSFEAGYSYARAHPDHSMIARVYDNTLFAKGLLLRTTNGIRDAVYSSGDDNLIGQYEQLGSIRRTITAVKAKETSDLQLIEILEEHAEILEKALTVASATYRDFIEDVSVRWQNIRDVLQDGEAAIEFVHFRLFDGNLFTDSVLYYALLLKNDSEAPVWIPLFEEKQIKTLTSRTTRDAEKSIRDLYAGAKGGHLYRLIWQPLEKELQGARRVYYSPSGMLHQIAFAAIPSDEHTGSPLLSDKYDLQLVSSAREIARLKKETPGTLPQGTAAVYGGLYYDADKDRLIVEARKAASPPTPQSPPNSTLPHQGEGMLFASVLPKNIQRGAGWSFLPGTEEEAEQIGKYLNERRLPNRLYSKIEGNEESFKRLGGTPAGIIHLATHGFFLEDIENEYQRDIMEQLGGGRGNKPFENPLLRSGLLLAGANRAWTGDDIIEGIEDGILTADEISQMNLVKTQLVVLSACETGLGEAKTSEGVFGLQRAFK